MSIILYTKPGCPYCDEARNYYNKNNVEFTEYDAQNDKRYQSEMLNYSGGDLTVPVIVQDGKYIQSGWGEPLRG